MKKKYRNKNVTNFVVIISILVVSGFLVIFSLVMQNRPEKNEISVVSLQDETQDYMDSSVLNGIKFSENFQYGSFDDKIMHYAYVTVLPTEDDMTGENITMDVLNKVILPDDNPQVNIVFQQGDENGPFQEIYDSNALIPNGTMRVRGYSSRRARQKSFKVKLSGVADTFLGQEVLNFNKHYYDYLRTSNKFCMDALESILDIGSLDTYFVKIYIRDMSLKSNTNFVDYGLFTMVEQPNKLYLQRHGLDTNGTVYKPFYFNFTDHEGALKSENDPYYDVDEFEKIIEIGENSNNEKFLEMIAAVNDISIDINETVATYFNKENFLTWMATEIIFGNMDSVVHNYLLYSPVNSKTWYYLPWDNDGTLVYTKNVLEIEKSYPDTLFGIGNYWIIDWYSRFYSQPENIQALNDKIEDIMTNYLTENDCKDLTSAYKKIYEESSFTLPDIKNLRLSMDEILYYSDNIHDLLLENVQRYYDNLQLPMPIYMSSADINGNEYLFAWDQSFDFQDDTIYYELFVSKDVNFRNIIYTAGPMLETNHKVVLDLKPGTYYFKVLIEDEHGNKQINREEYIHPISGDGYWAVRDFKVE